MSEWVSVETPEDIEIIGSEVLIWDGCECHIDYVETDGATGHYYMSNGTEPTHWMPLPNPPTEP